MSASDIAVILEDVAWKTSGVAGARVRSAARSALSRGHILSLMPRLCSGQPSGQKLTVLLTTDERLRALNAQFRSKDLPTNVLSFPAESRDGYLGDVAIAFGVTAREAAAAGISLEAHTLHLAVHGVLHLLGYDHVRSREAEIMERLEAEILKGLGIRNPYAAAKRQES